MRHFEDFGKWYDKYLNLFPFCIDDKYVKTLGIAWLFKDGGKWIFKPRITGGHQYYNAQFFIRVGFPFALFFHMRLSSNYLFQCGVGWKQSGRFAIHCRVQTDASAAAGYHAGLPNTGQATGWDFGDH